MRSGMILAMACTAVVASVLGSMALQYVLPSGDGIVTPLEQRCAAVAQQGYAIHSAYPGLTIDEMPVGDAREMNRLDEIWMSECVAKLPFSVIVEIADRVEGNVPSRGE